MSLGREVFGRLEVDQCVSLTAWVEAQLRQDEWAESNRSMLAGCFALFWAGVILPAAVW